MAITLPLVFLKEQKSGSSVLFKLLVRSTILANHLVTLPCYENIVISDTKSGGQNGIVTNTQRKTIAGFAR